MCPPLGCIAGRNERTNEHHNSKSYTKCVWKLYICQVPRNAVAYREFTSDLPFYDGSVKNPPQFNNNKIETKLLLYLSLRLSLFLSIDQKNHRKSEKRCRFIKFIISTGTAQTKRKWNVWLLLRKFSFII